MNPKVVLLAIYKRLPEKLKRLAARTLTPTYGLAAKVYLTNPQGRFLVVKPTYNDKGWDLPSGYADTGETPDETARREIFEETGLVFEHVQQRAVVFEPPNKMIQVLFSGELDHLSLIHI